MMKGHGLRRYFYEYVVHDGIRQVRNQTGQVVPISQAKAIRQDIDRRLNAKGSALADPRLGVSAFLTAVDDSLVGNVPGAQPLFGEHTSSDRNYQQLQSAFMRQVGLSNDPVASPALPISPYDPEWSERSSVKNAGTGLSYIPDEAITTTAQGQTMRLSSPECAAVTLWHVNDEGKEVESGPAMSDEDASGLTALRDKMSQKELNQVRQWVLDAGRDPRTQTIDRNRYMSQTAISRSAAILSELQAQGTAYEIFRDRYPGQIKARISGTTMDIRLTEPREREEFAGARIYDNGLITRYSTNHKTSNGKVAVYSPSPAEAVELLRFAQGRSIQRQDHPELSVGAVGTTHTEQIRRGRGPLQTVEIEDSYYDRSKTSMFAVKDYRIGNEPAREGSKVMIRREATDRGLATFFVDAERAEEFLSASVASARQNLNEALDAEGLIEHYARQAEEAAPDSAEQVVPPEFSSDAEVAAIQHSYWEVLTGRKDELLRPGATEQMLEQRLGEIGELGTESMDFQNLLGNLAYSGDSYGKVRAHAAEVADEIIGSWEPETRVIDGQVVEQRFDPVRVAKYMSSSTGQWSNMDNLAAALRRAEIDPDEMMGTGFQTNRFKDRMIRFDPLSAQSMAEHPSEFIRRVGSTVESTLARNATEAISIDIDQNGVIAWTGEKTLRDGELSPVTGYLGQVFDIGDYGELITRFAGDENALIVPGYEARITAQVPGETKSVEERTRLRGYEQALTERIEYQLAGDVLSGRTEVGEGTSLNTVYTQLYGTKHPIDFIDQHLVAGPTGPELDSWTRSILETEANRVRYTNDIKAGSTVYAEYRSGNDQSDPADDNHFDAWKLTGGRNMAVLTGRDQSNTPAPSGYFDPIMTGGAINQGIVRYLTTDARVGPDGVISPGDASTLSGSRAPLMTRDELQTLRFDPFDRQQMTASTLMQSSSVSEPTGTAMMTFGGWTADDPIVVSREFAEQNQIRGAGGYLRDLVVGDKLSDLHGNKGVVSLVVDRDMDPDQAREQDLAEEVAWFKSNPEMDVVMSPFSLISRRNAGSARELMEDAAGTRGRLVDPTDEVKEMAGTQHGIGQMRFIVTHMAVDEKTKIYDEDQMRAGKGRKASSQLAWALQAQDCPAIMQEFYGANTAAEANLREYLISTGLDMEADGTLRVIGRDVDHRGLGHEAIDDRLQRRLFPMPELERTSTGRLNTTAMRRTFGQLIGDKGGDLELPFPLTYPTGEQTEQVSATSWKMPILSSHLRSGQEFDDGTTVAHDYTNRYLDIFEQACKYRVSAEKLDSATLSNHDRQKVTEEMSKAVSHAQRKFESITTDLEQRVFNGKKNTFKTGLMSSQLPDSATAVWTADPRLDIDQVAISPAMSEQLGLTEDDHALVWRDPILRDAGLRYMRVAIDENLTGVAINPVMDACFDGDFDGDAVAVVKLHSEAAKAEAMNQFSVPANLLDTGVVKDGEHPLAMQRSLDTQVALSKNPELADEFDSATREANRIAVEAKQGMPADEVRACQADLTAELTGLYRQAQRSEFGAALTFSDREAHLRSVKEVCVETGAKGSEKKLEDYGRYLGDEAGTPGITEADQEASMFATAIKAHGTGLGGSYSQRAVRALRNEDLKAVLEVTYPVTQSVLQAKHDAAEARHKYEMLQGPGRDLWRGRKLEHLGSGQWSPVYEDGEPVQATASEWKQQFVDFYESPEGFNVTVNPDYVSRVGDVLADPRTGRMRNLEEDTSLEGSLMDRMAYGGDLTDLITAADNHQNLFDGEKNSQFASTATRRSRAEAEQQMTHPDLEASGISNNLIKADVVADYEAAAQPRGANRRSAQAVAVGTGGRLDYSSSIEVETTNSSDDFEMEG